MHSICRLYPYAAPLRKVTLLLIMLHPFLAQKHICYTDHMAYLVIAYPDLDKADYDWIQEYRKNYDPRYFNIVDPHVTLVFAVHDIEEKVFIDEATKQLESVEAFDFAIRVATINLDDSGDFYHEFLVPDSGYSNIVKLHDKLYSGLLAGHLRYDIDFIPHIGIGNDEDVAVSKTRVDDLNLKSVSIDGRIFSVDIVEYKDGVITTLKKVQLS